MLGILHILCLIRTGLHIILKTTRSTREFQGSDLQMCLAFRETYEGEFGITVKFLKNLNEGQSIKKADVALLGFPSENVAPETGKQDECF